MKISLIADSLISDNKGGNISHVSMVQDFQTLEEFGKLAVNFHIAPSTFIENKRDREHFQSCQYLYYDFDDGIYSSKQIHFKCQAACLNHIIIGSKNHLKDKQDGKGIIERFHLFIPLDQPIIEPELLKYAIHKISMVGMWHFDQSCNDVSRYFYRHSSVLYICDYFPSHLQIDRLKRMKEWDHEQRERIISTKKIIEYDDPLLAFKRTKYYRDMQNGCLNEDGQRYATSNRIIGAMKLCNLSLDQALDLFDSLGTYGKKYTRDSIILRWNKFN